MEIEKIAPFFAGWDETLIWSCLQGCMGAAAADDERRPASARITVGDFCFFAGKPNRALIESANAPILVPRDEEWGRFIEDVLGNEAEKFLRYAIKKEPHAFDLQKLRRLVQGLPSPFQLRFFDKELYRHAKNQQWSKDFCSQFADAQDFLSRGLGIAVVLEGKLVAGASSYTVYQGGIEIEIDTMPEFRQKGLASACGSALILECLKRGLYPSWDAHDLRSLALAEKLGYHLDHPYTAYCKNSLVT